MAVRTLNARGISEIPQRELVRACYAAPLAASLAGFCAALWAHVEALRGLDPLALFPRIWSLQLLLNIFGDPADFFLFSQKPGASDGGIFPLDQANSACARGLLFASFLSIHENRGGRNPGGLDLANVFRRLDGALRRPRTTGR
jgi:hypothetical protein